MNNTLFFFYILCYHIVIQQLYCNILFVCYQSLLWATIFNPVTTKDYVEAFEVISCNYG